MKLRSLRARLIAGAAFWTAGIIFAAMGIAILIARQRPAWGLLIHNSLIVVISVVLVTGGISVIRRGLSPFSMLQQRLTAVRSGRAARLEGDYPVEVAPLVDDLNDLLDERDHRVAGAVAKAGDLAHGLKTPLAILAQEIGRAEAAGQPDLAASIRRQVERMRRQIDSHLAQARVTAAGVALSARTSVAECAHGLVRTMERLHAGRTLVIEVDVPSDVMVRVPLEDLEEMIGNLLDNACKWATSRVTVSVTLDGTLLTVLVDDDGRGLQPSMRERVMQRGVRADEAAPGSGLGLAIVRDLAEAYRGTLVLERSAAGGVRAALTLPVAA